MAYTQTLPPGGSRASRSLNSRPTRLTAPVLGTTVLPWVIRFTPRPHRTGRRLGRCEQFHPAAAQRGEQHQFSVLRWVYWNAACNGSASLISAMTRRTIFFLTPYRAAARCALPSTNGGRRTGQRAAACRQHLDHVAVTLSGGKCGALHERRLRVLQFLHHFAGQLQSEPELPRQKPVQRRPSLQRDFG